MIGGGVGLLPIGAAADRHGPMPVLAAVNLGVAFASAWLAASSWSGEPASLAAGFAFGMVGFSCYPLASAALNQTAAPGARLAANGLLILVSGLGGCLGPLAAAALTPRCGPSAGFVVIGTGAAITAALIALSGACSTDAEKLHPTQPSRDHDPVASHWPPW